MTFYKKLRILNKTLFISGAKLNGEKFINTVTVGYGNTTLTYDRFISRSTINLIYNFNPAIYLDINHNWSACDR